MFEMCLVITLWMGAYEQPVAQERQGVNAMRKEYRFCGLNCAYILLNMLGKDVDYKKLERAMRIKEDGSSTFADMKAGMRAYGQEVVALHQSANLRSLEALPTPCILHVASFQGAASADHFLIFLGQGRDGGLALLDPPESPVLIDPDSLLHRWFGDALVPCRTEEEGREFPSIVDRRQRRWWEEPHLLLGSALSFSITLALIWKYWPQTSTPLKDSPCES